ncbi:hypothetical protein H3V53_41345 [Paraburkholderia bengalensis]|uniref:Uncharacterized protein n=1 Tax=Paraburkholderia bengalensis TaxID=2747562 RepID=A0ABU8J6L0_9BURK
MEMNYSSCTVGVTAGVADGHVIANVRIYRPATTDASMETYEFEVPGHFVDGKEAIVFATEWAKEWIDEHCL